MLKLGPWIPQALAVFLLVAPGSSAGLTVDFFSIDAGVDRLDGVLAGPAPYFLEFAAEGPVDPAIDSVHSVRVHQLDGTLIANLVLDDGLWISAEAFSSLTDLQNALAEGTYRFVFNDGLPDAASVEVPYSFVPTSDFANILAPRGTAVSVTPGSIQWACAAAQCDANFLAVEISDLLDFEVFVNSIDDLFLTQVSTGGLMLDPGATYTLEIDLDKTGNSLSVLIGTGPAEYVNLFSSANSLDFTIVPEPGTASLLILGLGLIVVFRRSSVGRSASAGRGRSRPQLRAINGGSRNSHAPGSGITSAGGFPSRAPPAGSALALDRGLAFVEATTFPRGPLLWPRWRRESPTGLTGPPVTPEIQSGEWFWIPGST